MDAATKSPLQKLGAYVQVALLLSHSRTAINNHWEPAMVRVLEKHQLEPDLESTMTPNQAYQS
jgi:hypothetical protein